MYETVRGVAESNAATAFANARSIVDLEQGTGLFVERSVQAWAMGHRFIIDFANFMYVNSHFVLTTGALVWLYLRHNNHFYFVRNMFMVAMGAGAGRLSGACRPRRRGSSPSSGFVDTIAYYVNVQARLRPGGPVLQPLRGRAEHARRLLADDRGAGDADRAPPGVKVLWAVYPLLVTFVVIVTGNHWLFDVLRSAPCVAGTSALVARHVLSRPWPAAWAWEPARARRPRSRPTDGRPNPASRAGASRRGATARALARRTGARRPPPSCAATCASG